LLSQDAVIASAATRSSLAEIEGYWDKGDPAERLDGFATLAMTAFRYVKIL
jgi:hypothetical protein